MSPARRARKLAMVTTITSRGKCERKKENPAPTNNVKAVVYRQTSTDLNVTNAENWPGEKGDEPARIKQSEPAELLRRGLVRRMLRNSVKETQSPKASSVEGSKEEVKRCNSAPVEVHQSLEERETDEMHGATDSACDLSRFSVEWQNLMSVPSISTANLLEEIEADLPSSYSLANIMDHTFHTVTNLRTCARLSRVGTSLIQPGEETKKIQDAKQDTVSKLKNLQREAFVQKTLIDQADKAVKLCKVRKKHLELEDLEVLKALLLARLRYNAVDLELQHFNLRGTESKEDNSGEISITDVHFSLNDLKDSQSGHYICVAFHKENVLASHSENKVVDGKLHFPVNFKFENLQHNFIIYLDLYKFICNLKPSKEGGNMFDFKKLMKMANQLKSKNDNDKNDQQGFVRIGSASLRLNDARNRDRGKVDLDFHTVCNSNFESTISVNVKVRVFSHSELNGFLDMFKNTCWHRLWCCQSDYHLYFWIYPEDKDSGKAPFESVLLLNCEDVQQVSMDLCIRPHSFMIRYTGSDKNLLLSACSNRDMTNWIDCLKSSIHCLQAWSPDF